jgi:hypothetical protein
MMSCIEGTTTKTGLQVKAFPNGRQYTKGKTGPDEFQDDSLISRLGAACMELHASSRLMTKCQFIMRSR